MVKRTFFVYTLDLPTFQFRFIRKFSAFESDYFREYKTVPRHSINVLFNPIMNGNKLTKFLKDISISWNIRKLKKEFRNFCDTASSYN